MSHQETSANLDAQGDCVGNNITRSQRCRQEPPRHADAAPSRSGGAPVISDTTEPGKTLLNTSNPRFSVQILALARYRGVCRLVPTQTHTHREEALTHRKQLECHLHS